MKDLKKVNNWIKQYKRIGVFLKRVGNKKGKSDNFMAGADALGNATTSGTQCAGGAPDPAANDAWNTLKVSQMKNNFLSRTNLISGLQNQCGNGLHV